MSGTADRTRQIAALADKLKPLGAKTRGMPIDAPDWNAVIDALTTVLSIDVARETDLTALGDQRYAPIDHAHLGQVSASWLDADLQARTTDGGGGVATRQVLAQMQAKLDALQTQVANLTALVQAQQGSVDRAAADNIDHTRQLLTFDGRLGGVEGLKTSVAQIATAQTAMVANVSTVLELRKSLSDATGAPIDVAGLVSKVGALQTLQDSLTGVDGKPLRLRDLQLQVNDVASRIPVSAGPALEERLGVLSADVIGKANASAQVKIDGLRSDLTAANAALSTSLNGKIDTGLAATRDAAAAAATAQVAAAESRLNANLGTGIATAQANLTTVLQKSVSDTVTASLADLSTRITTVVDARLPGLRAQIGTDVQSALTPVLSKTISDGLAPLQARIGAVETGIAALSTGLPVQIKTAVDASAAANQAKTDASIATQVQAAQTQIAASVDAKVNTAVTAGLAGVPAIATQAVTEGLKNLNTQIASAVASATSTLPAQIGAAVDTRLAAANIAGQIQTSTTALATQLRAEITASAAALQTSVTKSLSATTVSLRAEFTAALDARAPPHPPITGGPATPAVTQPGPA